MSYSARFDEYRTFGTEFEVLGVPREEIAYRLRQIGVHAEAREYSRKTAPVWRVSTDASIMPKGLSAEIISPILMGREGLAEVEAVVSCLDQIGCQVNRTCGFHVHHCCSDYTGKNVLSLLRFYSKFERVIDYLVAPSRRGNLNWHCESMVKDTDLMWVTELDKSEKARAAEVEMAFREKYTKKELDPDSGQIVESRSSRYHKVNICSYVPHGTIEFRQHQGTTSAEKSVNWVIFTQQIVNKAKEVSVSRQVSAKPTLGEMLRVLKIVDHEFIENQCTDPLILNLGVWLKKRYTLFRDGLEDE